MKKIAVVGVPGGWSSERLADTIDRLTGFRCLVDLAETALDLNAGKVWYGDLDLTSLDGIIIKKVGPAYTPKLLDRLEILRVVESAGVRIFSRPGSIARLLNRLSCTVGLQQAGIPMPPTIITENADQAVQAVRSFGRAIFKPLYTSKARGMVVLEDGSSLREDIINYTSAGNGQEMMYIQKMMALPGRDLGLVFQGGRYLATYARVGGQGAWNTTTASGGRYEASTPGPELIELAYRAQAGFNLDFTCVDVAETEAGPVVFEVSAFGGFRGLLEGCGIDAARSYAEYVLSELE